MEGVRQYVMSIVSAAILCGILGSISSKRSAPMFKLISGIFLTFVAIHPLADIQLSSLPAFADIYAEEAEAAVSDGKNFAAETSATIIKGQVEAYILDKADALGVQLTVSVGLNESGIPVSARLSGAVSPSAKSSLQNMLETDLGIPKEAQQWTE